MSCTLGHDETETTDVDPAPQLGDAYAPSRSEALAQSFRAVALCARAVARALEMHADVMRDHANGDAVYPRLVASDRHEAAAEVETLRGELDETCADAVREGLLADVTALGYRERGVWLGLLQARVSVGLGEERLGEQAKLVVALAGDLERFAEGLR
jgi:hypothetical protein